MDKTLKELIQWAHSEKESAKHSASANDERKDMVACNYYLGKAKMCQDFIIKAEELLDKNTHG